eukprot:5550953-Amphidinium_carterae.1
MGSETSPEYQDVVELLKLLVHNHAALPCFHEHIVKCAWVSARNQQIWQCSSGVCMRAEPHFI